MARSTLCVILGGVNKGDNTYINIYQERSGLLTKWLKTGWFW